MMPVFNGVYIMYIAFQLYTDDRYGRLSTFKKGIRSAGFNVKKTATTRFYRHLDADFCDAHLFDSFHGSLQLTLLRSQQITRLTIGYKCQITYIFAKKDNYYTFCSVTYSGQAAKY